MVVLLGVLIVGAWGGPVSVSAQQPKAQKKTNVSDEKGKVGTSSAVMLANEAASLVNYARENESAVAMLAAVEMLRRVKVREDKEHFAEMKSEGGKDVKQDAADVAPTFDTKKLLAEAKPWAKGNKPLTAFINAEMKKPAATAGGTLGGVDGPQYAEKRIRPGETQSFVVTFRGGEVAGVGVAGNGRSDLDLYVFDEDGNLIGSDTDVTDVCEVIWTPRWTGPFLIVVRNQSRSRNTYRILTN